MTIDALPAKINRRGIAVYFILALLLSMSIMTLTWHFSNAKVNPAPSLLMQLKAEYQMESAILLSAHRLRLSEGKFNPTDETWNSKQNIGPGIILRASCQELSSGVFNLLAYVEGPGMSKNLLARVTRESTTASEPASIQWRLEMLPNQGEKR